MTATIEQVDSVTDELVDAFARLLPVLTTSSPPPGPAELADVIGQPGTMLFVARMDGRIVGTLTLVTFRIPAGPKAWIEDVIVDPAANGHRIGEALTRHALAAAAARGHQKVDLTSRPSREAANHIYRKIGFELRETNSYRFTH